MACLFCEIVASRIPAKVLYQDDQVLAFSDINPKAPHHVLFIPKRHIQSLLSVAASDDALIGSLVRRARDLAKELRFDEKGFRCVFNTGDDAGYTVHHVHLHLLGGRALGWPPG